MSVFNRVKEMMSRKTFTFSLLVLLIIAVLQLMDTINRNGYLHENQLHDSLIYCWMLGCDVITVYPTIFLILLIPMSTLAGSTILQQEITNHSIQYRLTRQSKKDYIFQLLVANSVVAGIVSMLPLIVNVFLTALFNPVRKPHFLLDVMRGVPHIESHTLSLTLFQEHPFFNICLYILLAGVYAIVFSNLLLLVGQFMRKPFLILLFSLIFPIALISTTMIAAISPITVLTVYSFKIYPVVIFAFLTVLIIIQVLLIVRFLRAEVD